MIKLVKGRDIKAGDTVIVCDHLVGGLCKGLVVTDIDAHEGRTLTGDGKFPGCKIGPSVTVFGDGLCETFAPDDSILVEDGE